MMLQRMRQYYAFRENARDFSPPLSLILSGYLSIYLSTHLPNWLALAIYIVYSFYLFLAVSTMRRRGYANREEGSYGQRPR